MLLRGVFGIAFTRVLEASHLFSCYLVKKILGANRIFDGIMKNYPKNIQEVLKIFKTSHIECDTHVHKCQDDNQLNLEIQNRNETIHINPQEKNTVHMLIMHLKAEFDFDIFALVCRISMIVLRY